MKSLFEKYSKTICIQSKNWTAELPQQDTELLQELEQCADFCHKDDIGPDPFKLRAIIPKSSNSSLKIEDILTKFNLSKPTTTFSTKDSKVLRQSPKIFVHFYYGGKILNKDNSKENIIEWKKNLRDDEIILWIDPAIEDQTGLATLIDWAKENDINILNVKQVCYGWMQNEDCYLSEFIHQRFAGCSDFFRLWVIWQFGHIYADLDTQWQMVINETIKKLREALLTEQEFLVFGEDYDSEKIYNDLIFSTQGNIQINRLFKFTREFYKKTNSELFKQFSSLPDKAFRILTVSHDGIYGYLNKYHFYPNHIEQIPALDLHAARTICIGPGSLDKFVIEKKNQNGYLQLIKKVTGNEHSWLNKQNIIIPSHGCNIATKRVITCILHDLQYEPCVLLLDLYAYDLNEHNVGYLALHFIATHYPESLKEVQYVAAEYTLIDSHMLKLLFDKKSFPAFKGHTKLRDQQNALRIEAYDFLKQMYPEMKITNERLAKILVNLINDNHLNIRELVSFIKWQIVNYHLNEIELFEKLIVDLTKQFIPIKLERVIQLLQQWQPPISQPIQSSADYIINEYVRQFNNDAHLYELLSLLINYGADVCSYDLISILRKCVPEFHESIINKVKNEIEFYMAMGYKFKKDGNFFLLISDLAEYNKINPEVSCQVFFYIVLTVLPTTERMQNLQKWQSQQTIETNHFIKKIKNAKKQVSLECLKYLSKYKVSAFFECIPKNAPDDSILGYIKVYLDAIDRELNDLEDESQYYYALIEEPGQAEDVKSYYKPKYDEIKQKISYLNEFKQSINAVSELQDDINLKAVSLEKI